MEEEHHMEGQPKPAVFEEGGAVSKKQARRNEIKQSLSYRAVRAIATLMDKYFLDPLLGFLFPGIGDLLASAMVLPCLYVSLFKVRSVSLTLALIFNALLDIVLGLFPFWLGDLVDIFNRANMRNYKLIVGFVEGDKRVISEVRSQAWWMAVLIVVCCFLIYWMFGLAVDAGRWFFGLFA